jgi:type VI secretion system secreted protein VgrG
MADTDSTDSGYVSVTVSPDPGFTLNLDGMEATQELGRPFLIRLDLSSDKARGNLTSVLGSKVTVSLTKGSAKRYFHGVIARIVYAGLSGGAYRYHLELRPWIWLLSRVQDCKIFQNMAAWDIILKVFRDNGFSDFDDKRQNQAGGTVLEYCVQYRESSFDFVTRLMERFGIYYYFTFTDGVHTLELCDDPNSHTSVGAAIPFYFSQSEYRGLEDHVWEWSADLHLQSGAYTYRDYNFTAPSAPVETKSTASRSHPYSSFEVYDYPGPYDADDKVTSDAGTPLTDVRMQDISARVQVFNGKTNARSIDAGVKFTMSNFNTDTTMNQEYLILRSVSTVTMAEGSSDSRGGGELIDSYRVAFQAIPGSTTFRLDQRTRRPMIRGPQTALVVGNSGDEITTDQYGRIKVQFYWDRVGTKDENSSCWIRVAQTTAGAGWGSIIIPRVGMEAVVEFLEGNPDRPLVTGVVFNATNTVPNTLPDKKVLTTMKSNSSKGGGGYNEFTMDDTKGNEMVTFQAQYNYNKTVLNNEVVNITKDTTTTVKEGNRSMTVSQGNDSHTVSQGNQTVTVSQGTQSTTVSAGNYSLSVSAGGATTTTGQAFQVTAGTSVSVSASTQIQLSCGPCSITIAPSGITISGPQISASADASMSLSGGGSMSLTAGIISIN